MEFREHWRVWFESSKGRAFLRRRAEESDTILAKLIDKVYPSPASLDINLGNLPSGLVFRTVREQ